MVALDPYPRGFLVSRSEAKCDAPAEWSSIALADSGWTFSHDPRLRPQFATSDDGDWVLIYGLFLGTGSLKDSEAPASDLLRASKDSEEAFLDLLDFAGGRYVVLRSRGGDVDLFQDAMGMRSVYFSEPADLVASHVRLLHHISPHPARSEAEGSTGFVAAFDRTPYLGLDALLPNHRLRLSDWTISRFFPRRTNRFDELTHERRMDEFLRIWDEQLEAVTRGAEDIIMSITGGSDSRTTLALSLDHLRNVETFTYTARNESTLWGRMMAKDRRIVQTLQTLVDLPRHRFFYSGASVEPLPPEVISALDHNSVQDHGRWLIPHYIQAFTDDNYIHLRGFGYEIAGAYWGTAPNNNTLNALEKLHMKRLNLKESSESVESQRQNFLSGVQRWGFDTNLHHFHLFDLYYWELRMGRWGSEVLNENDLVFETAVLMNNRTLLEIALAYPISQRKSGFFFAELINRSTPVLNFQGKNDERNLYEIVRDERSQHESQLKDAGISLVPGLRIFQGDSRTHVPTDGNEVRMPRASFLPGTTSRRAFEPAPRSGELRFTVTSTYGREGGGSNWRYQILVNDQLYTSWDGGLSKEPVHVAISNLRYLDEVELSIVALTDRTENATWPPATRAHIEDIRFADRNAAGPCCVSLDEPRSTHVDWSHDVPLIDIHDLAGLPRTMLPPDTPVRIDVKLDSGRMPVLAVRRSLRPGGPLTIMFDGSSDPVRLDNGPFAGSESWMECPTSQVYVAEVSGRQSNVPNATFGQVSTERSVLPQVGRALRQLSIALDAPEHQDRIYVGVGPASYWALSAAIQDAGSSASIAHPIWDWAISDDTTAIELRETLFPGLTTDQVQAEIDRNTNLLNAFDSRETSMRIEIWSDKPAGAGPDRVTEDFQRLAIERPQLDVRLNLRVLDVSGNLPLRALVSKMRNAAAHTD